MKVLAINGSPRREGNTVHLLEIMAEELEKEGIAVETFDIGRQAIRGCLGCRRCLRDDERICKIKDDPVIEGVLKMREADGLILGAPTHFGGIPGTMKAFLDRTFYINRMHMKYKVATAVTTARRSGGVDVIHQLHNYFLLAGTITPPSMYWLIAHGHDKGESLRDGEGIHSVRENARAMAWLLKTVKLGKETFPLPAETERVHTNFVRD